MTDIITSNSCISQAILAMPFTTFACNIKSMSVGQRAVQIGRLKGLNPSALARAIGVTVQAVQQWETGETNPRGARLKKIANALGVPLAMLVDESIAVNGLAINSVAEVRADYSVGTGPTTHGIVPLISWVRAGALCDAEDTFQPGDAEAWLPCPVPFGEGAFALRVTGASMEPEYREGEVIYVDPTRAAKHGDDVIVRTPDGHVTFKRFQDTPEGRYLLALNPAQPERIIRVPEDTVICGVVIGSWMDRRK